MKADVIKPIQAAASLFGEQTKAIVLIELTHDADVRVHMGGTLLDISYCAQVLTANVGAQIMNNNKTEIKNG